MSLHERVRTAFPGMTQAQADVKEVDFADGKGKLLTYTTPEANPRFMISVMLRGPRNALECEAEYRVSSPKPDLIDACKSMREP